VPGGGGRAGRGRRAVADGRPRAPGHAGRTPPSDARPGAHPDRTGARRPRSGSSALRRGPRRCRGRGARTRGRRRAGGARTARAVGRRGGGPHRGPARRAGRGRAARGSDQHVGRDHHLRTLLGRNVRRVVRGGRHGGSFAAGHVRRGRGRSLHQPLLDAATRARRLDRCEHARRVHGDGRPRACRSPWSSGRNLASPSCARGDRRATMSRFRGTGGPTCASR